MSYCFLHKFLLYYRYNLLRFLETVENTVRYEVFIARDAKNSRIRYNVSGLITRLCRAERFSFYENHGCCVGLASR